MRLSRICLHAVLLLCIVFWTGSCLVWAQAGAEGTMTGNVTDPSGAPIPDATVTIRNIDTNDARSMKTGPTGVYSVTSLPVGSYQLKVAAAGFQTLEVQDIKLDVNATRRVDAHMTIGQLTETVSVEASAPLLNTENATTGQVIESKRVTELPLNGRNFQQLQLLTPGSVSTNNFQTGQGLGGGASSLTTNQTMNISNGGRPGQILFLIDGANASNQNGRGLIQQPAIDEIQEFKVQTSNMSAEFGYGSSAVIVSIKSGTNNLHGAAWEFLRNDAMDARSFFATRVEPLERNQFGANAGGPVRFRNSINGKDKTFWFFLLRGLAVAAGGQFRRHRSYGADAERRFSEFSRQIYDPGHHRPDPNKPGGFHPQPVSGQYHSGNRFNPVAKFLPGPFLDPLAGPGRNLCATFGAK